MHRTPLLKTLMIAFCLLSAVIAPWVMTGCSKEEDPKSPAIAEPGPDALVPAEPPSEAAQTSTLELLQWTPAMAQVACVIPPLTDIEANVLALDERLPSVQIKKNYTQYLMETGLELQAGLITNIQEVGESRGMDVSQPIAVYMDLEEFFDRVNRLMINSQGLQGEPTPEMMEEARMLYRYDMVMACSVTDQDLAKNVVIELFHELDAPSEESGTVELGGETIHLHDSYGYFFHGDKMFAGTVALLEGVIARLETPADLRYGTPAFPQASPEEGVMLLFGGRLYPHYEKLFAAAAQSEELQGMMPISIEQLKAMVPKEGTDEPIAMTFVWNEDKFELLTRMDLNYFPNALELSGKPGMLRLAPMLSENTLAFASLRITEPMKAMILQQVQTGMQANMQATGQDDAQAQQVTMIMNQAMEILGDEITLGFAAGGEGMPNGCAMLALKNPDVVKMMVQALAASYLESAETYKEIEISTIKAPIPVQIAVAFPKDIVLVSTNVTDMKTIIDRYLAEEPSRFLATLNPPIDTVQEHYGVLSLDAKLITDIVLPLAVMGGQLDMESMTLAQECANLVDTIRVDSSVDEQWMASEMTVHFQAAQ